MNRSLLAVSFRSLALCGTVALVALTGCEEKKDVLGGVKDAAKDAKDKVGDAAKATGEALKDAGAKTTDAVKDAAKNTTEKVGEMTEAARKEAVSGMEKSFDSVKGQIASLKEKAKNAPAAVKPTVDALLPQIETQVTAVNGKLVELKAATAETYQKISGELKPAMDKLTTMVKDLASKLGA